jgi:HK97 family phage portal protein
VTLFGELLEVRAANEAENPDRPLTDTTLLSLFGGHSTASGVNVTVEKAMGLPAMWRAVTLKAGVEASLPFKPFVGRAEEADPKSAAAQLMADPHPDMTRFEFWQMIHTHRIAWGNAYALKLRNRLGQVVELWPIHPSRVQVGRNRTTLEKMYLVDGVDLYGDDVMLHLPGPGYDGICGLSPIREARSGIGLAIAAEEFGGKFFGSGSLATGILQTEQRLTDTQAERLSNRWETKRSGMQSAHKTIVLDKGAKFEQLTIPPEDAQFLQTRQFQTTEICRLIGVPPFLMFETEKSTSWGTGLEQQAIGWVVYDLTRDLIAVEQRVDKQLLKPLDPNALSQGRPITYSKHIVDGLMRGDSAARSAFYNALFRLGALSTNDILELEDREGIGAAGDERFRTADLIPLGASSIEENTEPTNGEPAALETAGSHA